MTFDRKISEPNSNPKWFLHKIFKSQKKKKKVLKFSFNSLNYISHKTAQIPVKYPLSGLNPYSAFLVPSS